MMRFVPQRILWFSLDTEPATYEKLADSLVEQWERNPDDPPVAINASQGLETLYKTYIRAYEGLEERKIGDEEQKNRLLEKSREVREKIRRSSTRTPGSL